MYHVRYFEVGKRFECILFIEIPMSVTTNGASRRGLVNGSPRPLWVTPVGMWRLEPVLLDL